MYAIPNSQSWEVVLNSEAGAFGFNPPDKKMRMSPADGALHVSGGPAASTTSSRIVVMVQANEQQLLNELQIAIMNLTDAMERNQKCILGDLADFYV